MPPAKRQAAAPLEPPNGWTVDAVLKNVKKLRTAMGDKAAGKQTLADVGVSGVTKEVRAMDRHLVTREIERIAMDAALTIMRGEGFSYTMPARTASNMLYVPELDRLVLKDKMLERVFANASAARKTAITTRVLQLVLELRAGHVGTARDKLLELLGARGARARVPSAQEGV